MDISTHARSRLATRRQIDALAAYVAVGGSVPGAAKLMGIRPSTVKRHIADLRAKSGLSTEQRIDSGRADGWLVVPLFKPQVRSRSRSGGEDGFGLAGDIDPCRSSSWRVRQVSSKRAAPTSAAYMLSI